MILQAPTEIVLTSETTKALPALTEEEETPEEKELMSQIKNETPTTVSSKQPGPSIDPMTLSILPSGLTSQQSERQQSQRE